MNIAAWFNRLLENSFLAAIGGFYSWASSLGIVAFCFKIKVSGIEYPDHVFSKTLRVCNPWFKSIKCIGHKIFRFVHFEVKLQGKCYKFAAYKCNQAEDMV